MRPALKSFALAGVVALTSAWAPGRVGVADAQEGATPAKSARGGLLAKADGHQFEVFFYPTGVRVVAQDGSGTPLDPSKLAATATFYHPNSPKPWFSRPLRPTAESLDLEIGLSNAPQSGAKAAFVVTGLSGSGGSTTSFTVPVEFVPQQATTRPAAPAVATTPSPRYIYAPGYYGYGYYAYPGPETLPQRVASAPTYYSAPPRYGSRSTMRFPAAGHSVGPNHRDWATGRDSPLAKPWMQPRD